MSCCQPQILTVIANNALETPTANPVILTVGQSLTDVSANGCFVIRIPKAFLKNANPNPVQFTDGTLTLDAVTKCGDTLRYDSLVCYGDKNCKGCIRLDASRRTNPAQICVKTCLPKSSYSAPATPAAG